VSDGIEVETGMGAIRRPRSLAAFAVKPRLVTALHLIAHPLGGGYVELGMVAGEIDEDDSYGIFDDDAV
jgi:hypothetical protein